MRDPYLYEGTDVLKNLLGLREKKLLEEAESGYVTYRLKEIALNPLQGNYDYDHLLKMHRYIIDKTNEEVTTMRKELLKGLSDEQIKKVEACKSSEEILSLAKAEGVELNEEQLAAVSGGGCFDPDWLCPFCGHTDGKKKSKQIDENGNEYTQIKCKSCGATFREGENGRLL